jgi:PAS domain S-box-containing protein
MDRYMKDNNILKNIYDNLLDSIVLIDKNGIILYTNNAFTELLNYKETDLINHKLNQFAVKSTGEYYTNNSDLINVDDECIEEIKHKIALIKKDGSTSNFQNYQ